MSELNADVPILYCYLRAEYLYNGKKEEGKFYPPNSLVPCAIFGVASIQGRALGFHCVLDNGAMIYRLPISAFVYKQDAPNLPLDFLELWDCFSSHVTVLEYSFLRGWRVDVVLKDRTVLPGIYQFTVDWHGSSLADNPGEGGHKCAHIIALDNGCYCAQPNNRLRWYEPSFITAPFPERPDFETNSQIWSCENKGPKWCTENSERMFYDLIQPLVESKPIERLPARQPDTITRGLPE